MNKTSPLYKWLQTQPKEFIENVLSNDLLGDGQFNVEQLGELDDKYNNNPEDKNERE